VPPVEGGAVLDAPELHREERREFLECGSAKRRVAMYGFTPLQPLRRKEQTCGARRAIAIRRASSSEKRFYPARRKAQC
jgi:hypothetical protein